MTKTVFTEEQKEGIIKAYKEGKSTCKIAEEFGCNIETIRRLLVKNKVPRRSCSGRDVESEGEECDVALDTMSAYNKTLPTSQVIKLPLNLIKSVREGKKQDCVLTIVLSDTHFGHSDFLRETFYSACDNMKNTIELLQDTCINVMKCNIVLNGDIVSGKDVYKLQALDNLVTRGHWQVLLAETMLRDLLSRVEDLGIHISDIYAVRGGHDEVSENYLMYLKEILKQRYNTHYNSKMLVLDVGTPIGNYNVLFTHGRSMSETSPVPPVVVRDVYKLAQSYKLMGIPVERVCTGHTHNLVTDYRLEGMTFDVLGGFQRWHLSLSQRKAGFFAYLYTVEGECVPIEFQADTVIEEKEKLSPTLEFENLKFYGEKLMASYLNDEKASNSDANS